MRRDAEVERFVQSLADARLPNRQSANVYRNATRRANLKRWLNTYEDSHRSTIFVGEALGRDGGAITGIPFVSPNVLTSGDDPWGAFGPQTSYSLPEKANPNQKERTATRFWKHVPSHLDDLPRPLTWNIFPFWPYQVDGDGRRFNRTPTKEEIDFGTRWLLRLIEMFPNSKVIAVGNHAEITLEWLGIESFKILHPSRGSDSQLADQLTNIVNFV